MPKLKSGSPRVLLGLSTRAVQNLNTINTYIAMSVQTEQKHTNGRRLEIQISEVPDSDCPDATDSGAVNPDDQMMQARQ